MEKGIKVARRHGAIKDFRWLPSAKLQVEFPNGSRKIISSLEQIKNVEDPSIETLSQMMTNLKN